MCPDNEKIAIGIPSSRCRRRERSLSGMGRRGLLKEGLLTPSSCEDRRRSCLMPPPPPPPPPPSSFSSSTHASSSSSVSFLSSLARRVLSMDLGRPLRGGGRSRPQPLSEREEAERSLPPCQFGIRHWQRREEGGGVGSHRRERKKVSFCLAIYGWGREEAGRRVD